MAVRPSVVRNVSGCGVIATRRVPGDLAPERRQHRLAKARAQDPDGEEVAAPGGPPVAVIGGQPAGGDEAVNGGMRCERGHPRVQHRAHEPAPREGEGGGARPAA